MNTELERISITLPASLAREVEGRIEAGHYASASEWIRHAIREQLRREADPFQRLTASDPRVIESLELARRGNSKPLDTDALQ
jgi:antitoxin ParD1/3/4